MPQRRGVTNKALPSSIADGVGGTLRLHSRGTTLANNTIPGIVEEGTNFVQCRTPATSTAVSIQTTFAATNAVLTVRQGSQIFGQERKIIPLSLRLICTTVPATTTRIDAAIVMDNIIRYSSGGTQLVTGFNNSNMDTGDVSRTIIHFGALTLSAASVNSRIISRAVVSNSLPIQFDEFSIYWNPKFAEAAIASTPAGARKGATVMPCMIGPGQTMSVHLWFPGNATTAGQYEVEFMYMER